MRGFITVPGTGILFESNVMFKIPNKEFKILSALDTPQKIQTFLDGLPFNYEKQGETCMSPLRVLKESKAHCIEGAMLACVCLLIQGEKPCVVNLKVSPDDYDHIITIFRRNGYYGAISKTNHVVLRYRDPVYRTIRELVMSYFHEYFLTENGRKTLKGYSNPINMNRFGKRWIVANEDLWDIAEKIFDAPINEVVPKVNQKHIRLAQAFECTVCSIKEYK